MMTKENSLISKKAKDLKKIILTIFQLNPYNLIDGFRRMLPKYEDRFIRQRDIDLIFQSYFVESLTQILILEKELDNLSQENIDNLNEFSQLLEDLNDEIKPIEKLVIYGGAEVGFLLLVFLFLPELLVGIGQSHTEFLKAIQIILTLPSLAIFLHCYTERILGELVKKDRKFKQETDEDENKHDITEIVHKTHKSLLNSYKYEN